MTTDQPTPAPAQIELKPCPFCGGKAKRRQGKTTHCQLHGEPSAKAIVYCDNHLCKAKPQVEAGDCYQSGGYKAALAEAIAAWNIRNPQEDWVEQKIRETREAVAERPEWMKAVKRTNNGEHL